VSIHDDMTFDFTMLRKIAELAGLSHRELASLLKITMPTFYSWCGGRKPQTVATYESACQTLKAIKRGLVRGDFPMPERYQNVKGMSGNPARALELAKRYAKNYVAK
jgi:transcriptional regulator with XRE-family HTH domain